MTNLYSKNIFRFIRPVHVHLKTDKVDLKKNTVKKFYFAFFASTVWSVNDGLSQNLRKPAGILRGRFPTGFRIFY